MLGHGYEDNGTAFSHVSSALSSYPIREGLLADKYVPESKNIAQSSDTACFDWSTKPSTEWLSNEDAIVRGQYAVITDKDYRGWSQLRPSTCFSSWITDTLDSGWETSETWTAQGNTFEVDRTASKLALIRRWCAELWPFKYQHRIAWLHSCWTARKVISFRYDQGWHWQKERKWNQDITDLDYWVKLGSWGSQSSEIQAKREPSQLACSAKIRFHRRDIYCYQWVRSSQFYKKWKTIDASKQNKTWKQRE